MQQQIISKIVFKKGTEGEKVALLGFTTGTKSEK